MVPCYSSPMRWAIPAWLVRMTSIPTTTWTAAMSPAASAMAGPSSWTRYGRGHQPRQIGRRTARTWSSAPDETSELTLPTISVTDHAETQPEWSANVQRSSAGGSSSRGLISSAGAWPRRVKRSTNVSNSTTA